MLIMTLMNNEDLISRLLAMIVSCYYLYIFLNYQIKQPFFMCLDYIKLR